MASAGAHTTLVWPSTGGHLPVISDSQEDIKDVEENPLENTITEDEVIEKERWAHIFDRAESYPASVASGIHFSLPGPSCSSEEAVMEEEFHPKHFQRFTSETLSELLQIQRLDSSEVLYEKIKKPPKILGRYLFGDQIGEGSYGKVKECLDADTLCRRAVKILKLDKLKRKVPFGVENVVREIELLRKLSHLNIIELVEVLRKNEKHKLYMVMEFCVGSMQEMLDGAPNKRLPIWQAHKYTVHLVDGLEYLHSLGIVHKDIKPGNLLFGMDETLKISDMGVAEEISLYQAKDIITVGQGTPKFQPPEIACGKYTEFRGFPVDWWSTGVTLYNMVSGEYPFDGQGQALLKLYDDIVRGDLIMPKSVELDGLLEDFLRGLLRKKPEKRFGEREIRKHEWFIKKHPYSFLDGVPLPRFRELSRKPSGTDLSFMPYLEEIYLSRSEAGYSDSEEEKRLWSERELRELEGFELTAGGSQPQSGHKAVHNVRSTGSEGELRVPVTKGTHKEKRGPVGKAKKKFNSCKVN